MSPTRGLHLLYRVTVARDVYLGTPEEVLSWMSKGAGSPSKDVDLYMKGVATRISTHDPEARVDVSSPIAFLLSLERAGFLSLEERAEASRERVDPEEALGDGPVAFGDDVSLEDLESLGSDEDEGDAE